MNTTILVDKSNAPSQYGPGIQQSMASVMQQPSTVLSLKDNFTQSITQSSWDSAKKLPWKKESFVALQRENFTNDLPWKSKVFS
jgi:hypothetical protein